MLAEPPKWPFPSKASAVSSPPRLLRLLPAGAKIAGWVCLPLGNRAFPRRTIKLHFIPSYCPHLNPIERLWGVMHRNVTHNKCYATCQQFADATLGFLREIVPRNWANLCDSVTDNFRVINPKDFRVMR
jgi:hypothetical protein